MLATVAPTRLRADEAPLYEQEPYDTIKLDAENKNVLLKVFPLELPGRKVPAKPKEYDELEIRLVDRPRNTYRVLWSHIAEVKLFERMVLDEADRLTELGKFDEAYPYYQFLERRYPKMEGLAASYEKYQFVSAAAAYKQQRYEESLGILWQLFDHDASYKNLTIAIDRVADKLIQRRFDADDLAAARSILEQVLSRLKDKPHPLTEPWTERLQAAATARLTQAKADFAAGKYPQANRACRQALVAWPDVPEAHALAAAIRVKYPEVVVGVTSLGATNAGSAEEKSTAGDDWAASRDARLLTRNILELARIGPDGNVYTSPLATLNHDKDSRKLTLTVKSGLHWPDGVRPLTAADLARSLLAAADPRHPAFRPEWQAIAASVSASDVYRLDIDLRAPVARIEPWLSLGVWRQYEPADEGAQDRAGEPGETGLGPYRIESASENEARFVALPNYFAAAASQPREITEHRYNDDAAAIQALRSGEVQVVDRLGPWDAANLAGATDLEVEPYAAPDLHMLRFNLRRPLIRSDAFRRAIVHALDPAAILRDDLARGKTPPGVSLSNSVFASSGSSTASALVAGETTADPAVAKVLVEVARVEAAARDSAAKLPAGTPQIILSHPADDVARIACLAIQRQLRSAGFTVVLQETSSHEAASTADADLQYVEWMPLEPVVELGRFLEGSPAGENARQQLALARSDADIADGQRAVEQVIHDETLLLPLWRLPVYAAYHHDLQGLGSRPVTLYQNVEQWRLAPPEASQK
jgi:ABC-type transport system substrate-binding protein